jgi:hypothetical protein
MKCPYPSLLLAALLLWGCTTIDRIPLRQQRDNREIFERITISDAARGGSPLGIAAGKLSGGTVPDLAITSWGSFGKGQLGGIGEGAVSILLGADANNRLLSTKDEYVVGLGASGIAVADLNNDGKLDLAIVATNGITGAGAQIAQPGQLWIYYGNGDGTFGKPRIERSPIAYPASVVVGDLNRDGYADIVLGSAQAKAVAVFWGGPKAALRPTAIPLAGTSRSLSLGRFFSKDALGIAILGRKDAAVGAEPNLSILDGDGRGALKELIVELESQAPDAYQSIASADFNDDGLDDIVVHARERLSIYLSHKNEMPRLLTRYRGQFLEGAVQVADFDNDGHADILIPTAPHGFSILFGLGIGVFLERATLQLPVSPLLAQGDAQQGTPGLFGGLIETGGPAATSINRVVATVADFDGKGYPDVLVALKSSLMEGRSLDSPDAKGKSGTSLVIFKNRLRAGAR